MDLWDRIKMFINSGYRIPAAYILNRWPDLHKFQFFSFRNQLCRFQHFVQVEVGKENGSCGPVGIRAHRQVGTFYQEKIGYPFRSRQFRSKQVKDLHTFP